MHLYMLLFNFVCFEIYVKGVFLSGHQSHLVRVIYVTMDRNSLSVLMVYGSRFVTMLQVLIHSIPDEHLHSFHWDYYKQCCYEHSCLCLPTICEHISLVEIHRSAIAGA